MLQKINVGTYFHVIHKPIQPWRFPRKYQLGALTLNCIHAKFKIGILFWNIGLLPKSYVIVSNGRNKEKKWFWTGSHVSGLNKAVPFRQ